jgi:hypothetical protein
MEWSIWREALRVIATALYIFASALPWELYFGFSDHVIVDSFVLYAKDLCSVDSTPYFVLGDDVAF